ncbi:MAG: ABC transporter ATP-binding protein [Dehalococcoidia bacterium]|nr:ABC transporter ATP-binding protein [Dehalococcoidia bacterium]
MPINKDLAIQTVNLSKRFGKITALDSLNLEIESHSIYGFLGPNGSGKTTAIRLMLGLSRPSNGNAYIHGFSCARRQAESRQIIGYLPDVPNFFGYMSGLDYLVLCGKLFGLDNKAALNRAWPLLELTGVKEAAHRKANGYSRGMKQRLGLAAAMMGNPKVLFLDEPVSAMDPLGRADVLDIIKGIKEKATVFLSTHILSDVERVSDKVGIIDHGRLITSASIQELKQQFSQNCITVNTLEEPTPLVALIKMQGWCSDVIAKQNERGVPELVIYLKDPIAARDNLPKLIIQQNFTIINYVTTLPSLEDIFIKLAGAK